MEADDVKEALRAWGLATVNRFAYQRADRTVHVLAKVRSEAPGTRERAERKLVGRDGTSRRRMMGGAAGLRGVVPMWACDPVRAANDASHPHDNPEIAVDQGIPEEYKWIERAIASLERTRPMQALVVRTEYTVSASQKVKARMIRDDYGGHFSKDMYRKELQRAIDWIAGARAAA